MSKFRRRIIMAKKSLPYVPLEYIASTGTQYIDTGINADSLLNIMVKCRASTDGGYLFGSSLTVREVQDNDKCFYLKTTSSDTRTQIGGIYTSFYPQILNQISEIDMSASGVYLNGELKGTYSGLVGFDSQYPVYIFCYNVAGTPTSRITGRIYYSKIYEDGILMQSLVSCKDLNGVVCMYDKVSKQFFYNQGTGSFIAGPEI